MIWHFCTYVSLNCYSSFSLAAGTLLCFCIMSAFVRPTHLTCRPLTGPVRAGEAGGCDYTERRCEAGAVCLEFRADHRGEAALGHCVNATVRFVTSHSNSLACQVRQQTFKLSNFCPKHMAALQELS